MVMGWRQAPRAAAAQSLSMDASTVPQITRGIITDEEEDELGCPSSSSSGDSTNSNDDSSELRDDAISSSSSSSSTSTSPPLEHQLQRGALYEMSSLMTQLPFKGLSKHFQGKSQSFTSLSSVRCLEDLAKPERPYKKKLKPSCKSYGGGLDAHTHHKPCSPRGCCSRAISKKPSRGTRQGFLGSSRPPVHAHRSTNFSAQTLLFA